MKVLALVSAAALALPALAAEPTVATHTQLHDCAIQEVLPGRNMTGAFVRFVHTGAPVQLLRAEVPSISQRIELHSMHMVNNVMEMTPMTNLQLNAGERIFKKGGDHVMLFDIAQKPAVGSTHTLTVYFSDNTKASCQAVIKSLDEVMKEAGMPPGGHPHHHGHKH